ncbi:BOLA class I histocompatibility antigen, alpha chain BL3-7-like isoform X2 [Brachyhypopomus gauderio]
MEKNVDTEYWTTETQTHQGTQEIFKKDVTILMERFNQTKGVHTVQVMYGCKLEDDGTKTGYMQFGYDGEDYIHLDLNTLTWTAANAKAVITKFKWNINVGDRVGVKNYLENTCIEWLQKYVSYGRYTLERKDPPEVTLFQKDSSSPVVCHATGFFPRGVQLSWKKNGVNLYKYVELTETLPNQDGTFQKRSILTVSPEELDRNEYTCVVQHSGLEKDLVLRVTERRVLNSGGARMGVVIGAVNAALLLFMGCAAFSICRRKSGGEKRNTKSSKSFPNSKISESESFGTNSHDSVTSTKALIQTER